MRKVFKWMGFVVAGVATLVLIAVAYIFIASEYALNREHPVLAESIAPLSVDPAARNIEIAEGKRLAQVVGCNHCHGDNLTGLATLDIPDVARFVSPNVTKIAPLYDDAQLATLIRRGIRRDGTGTLFMPAEMFVNLSDADLSKIIAYVRSVPQAEGITEKTEVRPLGRMIMAMGKFTTGPDAAAPFKSADIDVDPADPVSRGRYLVMSACSECHGHDLNGREVAHSPPLSVAKAYSPEDFARLMHDGTAIGGRTTELMSPTAVARFSVLTPDEVSDMYAFLQSRG